jgi:hypothetical protein
MTRYSRSTWCATGEMMVPEGFFRRMNRAPAASSTKYVGLLWPYPIFVDTMGSFRSGRCFTRYLPSVSSSRSCRVFALVMPDMLNTRLCEAATFEQNERTCTGPHTESHSTLFGVGSSKLVRGDGLASAISGKAAASRRGSELRQPKLRLLSYIRGQRLVLNGLWAPVRACRAWFISSRMLLVCLPAFRFSGFYSCTENTSRRRLSFVFLDMWLVCIGNSPGLSNILLRFEVAANKDTEDCRAEYQSLVLHRTSTGRTTGHVSRTSKRYSISRPSLSRARY